MRLHTTCQNCSARSLQDKCADLHLSISGYLNASESSESEARDVLIESIADVRLAIEALEENLDCNAVVETLMFEKREVQA